MRVINIIGEIDEKMTEAVFERLYELEAESKDPVTVFLSSDGGCAYDALAITGRLVSSPCVIHINAFGRVMSAAVLILASGDVRTADPMTWFMVHEDSGAQEGNTSGVVKAAIQMRREEQHWNSMMQHFTGTSAAQWDKLSRKTTYFQVSEAKKLGLVD